MTVRFDPPAAPEQLLGHAPAAKRTDLDGLTWHWEYKRAAESVAVAFMAPAWWRDFAAAQAAAAAPGAGLAEHVALSRYYRQLAALPAPSFQNDANYYDRYYPAEVAALEAALAAAGGAAPAEQAAAHARLAELYRERAGRLGAGAGDGYLQMAATELQAAGRAGQRQRRPAHCCRRSLRATGPGRPVPRRPGHRGPAPGPGRSPRFRGPRRLGADPGAGRRAEPRGAGARGRRPGAGAPVGGRGVRTRCRRPAGRLAAHRRSGPGHRHDLAEPTNVDPAAYRGQGRCCHNGNPAAG